MHMNQSISINILYYNYGLCHIIMHCVTMVIYIVQWQKGIIWTAAEAGDVTALQDISEREVKVTGIVGMVSMSIV